MDPRFSGQDDQSGFSLLEVILSLGILVTLSLALTAMLRANLDIRDSLSQNSRVSHKLARVIERVALDLELAYLISDKDIERFGNPGARKISSIFQIIPGSKGDEVRLTTYSHSPLKKDSKESDTSFVVYRLEDDKDTGRTNLVRLATPRVPESFSDEGDARILAKGISEFRVQAWRGDQWSKDRWDSTRREWKNILPKMIRLEISAWEDPADPESRSNSVLGQGQEPFVKIQTVLYLMNSIGMKELRAGPTSVKWEKL